MTIFLLGLGMNLGQSSQPTLYEAWFKSHLGEALSKDPKKILILSTALDNPSAVELYLKTARGTRELANMMRGANKLGVSIPVSVKLSGTSGIDILGNGPKTEASVGVTVDLARAMSILADEGEQAFDAFLLNLISTNPDGYGKLLSDIYEQLNNDNTNFQGIYSQIEQEDENLLPRDVDSDTLVMSLDDDPLGEYIRGAWLSLSEEKKKEANENPGQFFSSLSGGQSPTDYTLNEIQKQVEGISESIEEMSFREEGKNLDINSVKQQLDSIESIGEELLQQKQLSQIEMDNLRSSVERLRNSLDQTTEEIKLTREELREVSKDVKTLIAKADAIQLDVTEIKKGVNFLVQDRLKQLAQEQHEAEIQTARNSMTLLSNIIGATGLLPESDVEKLNVLTQNLITMSDVVSAASLVGSLSTGGALTIMQAAFNMGQLFGPTTQEDPTAKRMLELQLEILNLLKKSIELQQLTVLKLDQIIDQLNQLMVNETLQTSIIVQEIEKTRNAVLQQTIVSTQNDANIIESFTRDYYIPQRHNLTFSEREGIRQQILSRNSESLAWLLFETARSNIANFGISKAQQPPLLPNYGFDIDVYRKDPDLENRFGVLPDIISDINQRYLTDTSLQTFAPKYKLFNPEAFDSLVQPDYWMLAVAWYLDLSTRLSNTDSPVQDELLERLCLTGCQTQEAVDEIHNNFQAFTSLYTYDSLNLHSSLQNLLKSFLGNWQHSSGIRYAAKSFDSNIYKELAWLTRNLIGFSVQPQDDNPLEPKPDGIFEMQRTFSFAGFLEPVTRVSFDSFENQGYYEDGKNVFFTGCARLSEGFIWSEAATNFFPDLLPFRNDRKVIPSLSKQLCFNYPNGLYFATKSGGSPSGSAYFHFWGLLQKPESILDELQNCSCGVTVSFNQSELNELNEATPLMLQVFAQFQSQIRKDFWEEFKTQYASDFFELQVDSLDKSSFALETAIYLGFGECVQSSPLLQTLLLGGSVKIPLDSAIIDLSSFIGKDAEITIAPLFTSSDIFSLVSKTSDLDFFVSLQELMTNLGSRTLWKADGTPLFDIDNSLDSCRGPVSLSEGLGLLNGLASLFPDLLPQGCKKP